VSTGKNNYVVEIRSDVIRLAWKPIYARRLFAKLSGFNESPIERLFARPRLYDEPLIECRDLNLEVGYGRTRLV
jgi:hypothetical protein